MKKITSGTYKKDKYYPRVVQAVIRVLTRADFVAPVEVMMEIGHLSKADYLAWRKGQVPYLERVFVGNLSKAQRILRILGWHMQAMGLRPSQTVYHHWGKGRRRVLQFSKSGAPSLEAAYCRHYLTKRATKKKAAPAERPSVDEPEQGRKGRDAADQPGICEGFDLVDEGWEEMGEEDRLSPDERPGGDPFSDDDEDIPF